MHAADQPRNGEAYFLMPDLRAAVRALLDK